MKGRLLAAVLSMSLAGSAAILLVLPLRRLLRGAPKAFCYLLWFGALFRFRRGRLLVPQPFNRS